MALFGSKKKTEEKKETEAVSGSNDAVSREQALIGRQLTAFNADEILRQPRITEKAALQSQHNVYVFEVHPDAGKNDIVFAIKRAYNVSPLKVRTAQIPRRRVRRSRGGGQTSRGKKAYVYLKKGDSISL